MSEDALGLSAYLRALSALHSSQVHAMRSQVGNLTLHVGLLGETLRRVEGVTPQSLDRPSQLAVKIEADARGLVEALERWLSQTRLDSEPAAFDLRDTLRDLETLVRPYVAERRVQCTLKLPTAPTNVVGDARAVHRILLTAVVERLKSLPAGGGLDLRLEPERPAVIVCLEARTPGGAADRREFSLPVRSGSE